MVGSFSPDRGARQAPSPASYDLPKRRAHGCLNLQREGTLETSEISNAKANVAGLTRLPGKVSLLGDGGEVRSGVKVETDEEGVALEHQGDFQRIAAGQGMEAYRSAGNDGGHAQQADSTKTRKLVLEIARDHVADFADG